MDMLRVFFEKTEEDTSVYSQDKSIWQYGEEYTAYQGKYPIIFLTFKDVKCSSWEETIQHIHNLIIMEYQRHMMLAASEKLSVCSCINIMEKKLSLLLMNMIRRSSRGIPVDSTRKSSIS